MNDRPTSHPLTPNNPIDRRRPWGSPNTRQRMNENRNLLANVQPTIWFHAEITFSDPHPPSTWEQPLLLLSLSLQFNGAHCAWTLLPRRRSQRDRNSTQNVTDKKFISSAFTPSWNGLQRTAKEFKSQIQTNNGFQIYRAEKEIQGWIYRFNFAYYYNGRAPNLTCSIKSQVNNAILITSPASFEDKVFIGYPWNTG